MKNVNALTKRTKMRSYNNEQINQTYLPIDTHVAAAIQHTPIVQHPNRNTNRLPQTSILDSPSKVPMNAAT